MGRKKSRWKQLRRARIVARIRAMWMQQPAWMRSAAAAAARIVAGAFLSVAGKTVRDLLEAWLRRTRE